MKTINLKEEQLSKINEDAKIVDINSLIDGNDVNSNNEELSALADLESLVDNVMDAVEIARDYYIANKGCFGEKESYAKKIDDKMKYILSDLF